MSDIIYTWDCRTVDCYPTHDEQGTELTDVVYNIHWRLTGTEAVDTKTYTATVIGTQMVSADDIDPATFVPFEDLTNEETQFLDVIRTVQAIRSGGGQHIDMMMDL